MTTDTTSPAVTTAKSATGTAPVRGWAAVVERVSARRAANSARAQLEREMFAFGTAAERLELETMLARYEPAEVADIHRIMDRHRAA